MIFTVDLELVATRDGGRQGKINVGYRSSWDTGDRLDDGAVHVHDAPIIGLQDDPLSPGARTIAQIRPVSPEYWRDVGVGDQLRMLEGRTLVGNARVLSRSDASTL